MTIAIATFWSQNDRYGVDIDIFEPRNASSVFNRASEHRSGAFKLTFTAAPECVYIMYIIKSYLKLIKSRYSALSGACTFWLICRNAKNVILMYTLKTIAEVDRRITVQFSSITACAEI